MVEYSLLVLIGLLAGLLGGLLGIGGSVLMIPGMTFVLGPAQHLYQGAAMIVNFFVALPAVVQHLRARAILGPVIRVMIPAAVVSVLVGVWFSDRPWFRGDNQVYLARVYGGFMLYMAAYNVYRFFSRRQLSEMDASSARNISRWRTMLAVGMPMGLSGGLLGIGGGVVAVPLQQVFLRVPLRRAVANSATTIMVLSIIGACYKNYANMQVGIPLQKALMLALMLIPSAMIGGYLGGKMTHLLPRRVVRFVMIAVLLCSAIGMLCKPFPSDAAATQPVAQVLRTD
ncbi:MAG: sulfite exporter TauE/SafE family protein [Phycisphaerales bacterium]|nr:sulfite exporter TauE/SafE family protein [Phycisphaerales bacterium]